jgi:hypothetical protein
MHQACKQACKPVQMQRSASAVHATEATYAFHQDRHMNNRAWKASIVHEAAETLVLPKGVSFLVLRIHTILVASLHLCCRHNFTALSGMAC